MRQETLKKVLKAALVVGGVSALAPMVQAQVIGVGELEKMLVPTKQKVERGEELYQQNCAVCHGDAGEGKANISLAGSDQRFRTTDFTAGEYKYGAGPIQIYNAITFGLAEALPPSELAGEEAPVIPNHPVYPQLQYQSRWDLVHYVRSLGPTEDASDPAELVATARERAAKGVCDPSIRSSVTEKMEMKGDEQLARGKEVYDQSCASCHGAEGAGDGAAAAALNPPPRSFVAVEGEWTNGSSQLAIYNTLQNGIAGSSMASYSSLPEDDIWALVHYVREWVPEEARQDVSESQITDACRAMSKPEPPEPVSIEVAMAAMVKDQPEERAIRLQQYGPVKLERGASAERGAAVYSQTCAGCHGDDGQGNAKMGPYGGQRAGQKVAYLYLNVGRLVTASAGGTVDEFAQRSINGPHATLRDMSSASLLGRADWEDLQAYVAGFGGVGEITYRQPAPPEMIEAEGIPATSEGDAAADQAAIQPAEQQEATPEAP